MHIIHVNRENDSDEEYELDSDVEVLKEDYDRPSKPMPSTSFTKQDSNVKTASPATALAHPLIQRVNPAASGSVNQSYDDNAASNREHPPVTRNTPTVGKVYGSLDDAEKRIFAWHEEAYPDGRSLVIRRRGPIVKEVHHPVFTCKESEARSKKADYSAKCSLRIRLKPLIDVDAHVVVAAISSHSDACDRRARGEVVASSGDSSKISRNAAREHGRAVKTKDVTASARSKEVDDTDNLLFDGETSLEVGQIYRGARTNLIRDFMAWHEKTYPDHTVLSTPYKKANGLLNGYFKCKDKHTGVCQFRVIFDRLPDNSGFEITMSDSEHSQACKKLCKISRRAKKPSDRRKSQSFFPVKRKKTCFSDSNEDHSNEGEAESDSSPSISDKMSNSSDDEPLPDGSEIMKRPSSRMQSSKATSVGPKLDEEIASESPDAAKLAIGSSSRAVQLQNRLKPVPSPESKWVEDKQPLATLAPYVRGRFHLHGFTTTRHLLDAGIETCEDFIEAVRQVCRLEPSTPGSMAEIATHFTLRAFI